MLSTNLQTLRTTICQYLIQEESLTNNGVTEKKKMVKKKVIMCKHWRYMVGRIKRTRNEYIKKREKERLKYLWGKSKKKE